MKLISLLLVIFLVSIAGSVAAFLVIKSNTHIQELPMHVRVGDHFGLNADTDALYFGTLLSESSGQRSFIIKNQWDDPMGVIISASGEMAPWVSFYPSSFRLEAQQEELVQANALIPPNTSVGNYSGSVNVRFRKPLLN